MTRSDTTDVWGQGIKRIKVMIICRGMRVYEGEAVEAGIFAEVPAID
jgi:hypothetical protein